MNKKLSICFFLCMCCLGFFLFKSPVLATDAKEKEFDKKYEFIKEDPGEQRLYIDANKTTKKKNIASTATVSLLIKGGKLYQAFKAKLPEQNPSYSISEMDIDCSGLKIMPKELTLYNAKNIIIGNYSFDRKWNLVQIKNTTDKIILDTVCKR